MLVLDPQTETLLERDSYRLKKQSMLVVLVVKAILFWEDLLDVVMMVVH